MRVNEFQDSEGRRFCSRSPDIYLDMVDGKHRWFMTKNWAQPKGGRREVFPVEVKG